MIDYHAFQQIHHLRDQDQLTLAQIARALGLHWQTVSKWAQRPRYERRAAPPQTRRPSKLDPFKGTIARLLATHPYTAAQLWSRLREEGYGGGGGTRS
jgi:transposase